MAHGTNRWANTATIPTRSICRITATLHRRCAQCPTSDSEGRRKAEPAERGITLDQIHYQSDAVYWNASASKPCYKQPTNTDAVKQQYDIIQDRFDDQRAVPPICAIIFCFILICGLNWETWVRFAIWFALGLIVYFVYSRKHSALNEPGLF